MTYRRQNISVTRLLVTDYSALLPTSCVFDDWRNPRKAHSWEQNDLRLPSQSSCENIQVEFQPVWQNVHSTFSQSLTLMLNVSAINVQFEKNFENSHLEHNSKTNRNRSGTKMLPNWKNQNPKKNVAIPKKNVANPK